MTLTVSRIAEIRRGTRKGREYGEMTEAEWNELLTLAQKSLRSETERSGWVPVAAGLPADQPGGWLVFNTDTGKLWFETNLPSWWNRKDERGREFDGPAVTHWREDFYPLPGPRK